MALDSLNEIMNRWSRAAAPENQMNSQLKGWAESLFPAVADQSKPVIECDCGGFKTYQTWNPHCHSSWCSSQNLSK